MAQAHTQAEYLSALQGLMPPGLAWPTDPPATQTAVLAGLAASFAAEDQAALDLLADAFPGTATNLLAEWEQTLGLPDPCEGVAPTLQQRRGQVVTRFANEGGQSIAYLLRIAEGLGYQDVSIQEYAPFRAGVDGADTAIRDESWASTFQVTVPDFRVFYFSADVSAAGEALLTIQNDVIVCAINGVKPAHTFAIFYSPPGQLDFSDPLQSGLLPTI
jgi:uncharacterized protein YmfQ (DUF2313 family)